MAVRFCSGLCWVSGGLYGVCVGICRLLGRLGGHMSGRAGSILNFSDSQMGRSSLRACWVYGRLFRFYDGLCGLTNDAHELRVEPNFDLNIVCLFVPWMHKLMGFQQKFVRQTPMSMKGDTVSLVLPSCHGRSRESRLQSILHVPMAMVWETCCHRHGGRKSDAKCLCRA